MLSHYVEKKVSSGSWESVDGGSGSFNPGSNNQSAKVWETEEIISVGSSACYRMHFYLLGGDSGSRRTVTACAHVVGDLNSSIELKAKRHNDEEYQDADEGTPLYVRPDEKIGLKAIYTPRVQSVANLRPGLVTVDGVEGSNNNANGAVKERFDGLIGSEPGWNNAFSIKADNGGSLLGWNYDVGDSSEHTEILSDGYSVKNVDDVGKTIKFTALTNENNSMRTTPKSAHVSYDSDSDSFSVAVNKNQLEVQTAENFIANDKLRAMKNYKNWNVNISNRLETPIEPTKGLINGDVKVSEYNIY